MEYEQLYNGRPSFGQKQMSIRWETKILKSKNSFGSAWVIIVGASARSYSLSNVDHPKDAENWRYIPTKDVPVEKIFSTRTVSASFIKLGKLMVFFNIDNKS